MAVLGGITVTVRVGRVAVATKAPTVQVVVKTAEIDVEVAG